MSIKSSMVVDISSRCIKIMCTRKFLGKAKIQAYGLIELPPGMVEHGNIKNVIFIIDSIKSFIKNKCINPSEVSFAIYGQDIMIRHVEIPLLNKKSIKKTIEWDISQYLSESLNNYIMDFQITEKIINDDKKAYGVLVVLVPNTKIEKYTYIAESLGVKLKAIDISANCISRVFNNVINSQKGFESIGIIDVGDQNTQLIILHNGKLFIQKELQFGLEDIVNVISDEYKIDSIKSYQYLADKFRLDNTSSLSGWEEIIKGHFNNVTKTFSSLIQFYLMDKSKKDIDKIFIVGEGSIIKGVENYFSNSLRIDAFILDDNKKFKQILGFKEKPNYTKCINLHGLLMRKE